MNIQGLKHSSLLHSTRYSLSPFIHIHWFPLTNSLWKCIRHPTPTYPSHIHEPLPSLQSTWSDHFHISCWDLLKSLQKMKVHKPYISSFYFSDPQIIPTDWPIMTIFDKSTLTLFRSIAFFLVFRYYILQYSFRHSSDFRNHSRIYRIFTNDDQ